MYFSLTAILFSGPFLNIKYINYCTPWQQELPAPDSNVYALYGETDQYKCSSLWMHTLYAHMQVLLQLHSLTLHLGTTQLE